MRFTNLGRTGLRVSVIGLGGGGLSCLGLSNGRSTQNAVRVVHHALDRGINLIDLAGAVYGTDKIVGDAIRQRRSQIVLSTKAALGPSVWPFEGDRTAARLSARIGEVTSFVTSGRVIEDRLDACLRRLKTDYIDVFNLHSVTPKQYDAAIDRVLPWLRQLKDKGKIRYIGITEAFRRDPSHQMLARAAAEGIFDSIMIGFNILNPSGAPIAAQARKHGSGIIAMYAIRRRLRDERGLQSILSDLVRRGKLSRAQGDARRLMKLLKSEGIYLTEAALRFCRHELGADVVLTGTGEISHLDANIAACQKEALPKPLLAEFRKLFGHVNFLTGD